MFKEKKVVTYDPEVFKEGGIVTLAHHRLMEPPTAFGMKPEPEWKEFTRANYFIHAVHEEYLELEDFVENCVTLDTYKVLGTSAFNDTVAVAFKILGVATELTNMIEEK
ncbi:hypothetical protein BH780_gp137 [Bacillus phage Eldridge]|uniref:Uncharacterized protein n=1 Tax=Bacillus phage Eldridge TaxID=1776293 RepID=A0A0Y0C571_9CAUD|nr:hypothetical protein BH780_gp137 [Bacillus phage Eldridge]AMB18720.1 hypothetical protein Eldridge_0140 [Bacillus phage Eldridge]